MAYRASFSHRQRGKDSWPLPLNVPPLSDPKKKRVRFPGFQPDFSTGESRCITQSWKKQQISRQGRQLIQTSKRAICAEGKRLKENGKASEKQFSEGEKEEENTGRKENDV